MITRLIGKVQLSVILNPPEAEYLPQFIAALEKGEVPDTALGDFIVDALKSGLEEDEGCLRSQGAQDTRLTELLTDLRTESAVAGDRAANPTREGSISQIIDQAIAQGFTDVADRLEIALSSTQPQPESGSGEEGKRTGLPDHHLLGTALCNVKHERFEQERLKAEGRFRFTCADHELSHGEKLAILTEEVGEVAQQVLEQPDRRLAFDTSGSRAELREELTQVAAVAVAWIESLFDEPAPTQPLQGSQVERWGPSVDFRPGEPVQVIPTMLQGLAGEWVKYDEYTALQAQLQRVEAERERVATAAAQERSARIKAEAQLQRIEEERDKLRYAVEAATVTAAAHIERGSPEESRWHVLTALNELRMRADLAPRPVPKVGPK